MVLVLVLLVLVTGGKQSQLLVLSLSLKFDNMDTNAQNRSRAYVTGPDFRLTYLFLSCRGTGPIFV